MRVQWLVSWARDIFNSGNPMPPGYDELPEEWKPKATKTPRERMAASSLSLWLGCYTLLVESGVMKRGGVPKRPIPKEVGALVEYATELLGYCRETKRLSTDAATGAAETVERHLADISSALSHGDDPR